MCEFCGCANNVNNSVTRVCIGQRAGVHSDDLYLPDQSEDDYQNLEDTLVVFCVDISGSMIVTTEVCMYVKGSGGKTYSDPLLKGMYQCNNIENIPLNHIRTTS